MKAVLKFKDGAIAVLKPEDIGANNEQEFISLVSNMHNSVPADFPTGNNSDVTPVTKEQIYSLEIIF